MGKKGTILFYALLIIVTLLARRFNWVETAWIDLIFLYALSLPFAKQNKPFFAIATFVFAATAAYLYFSRSDTSSTAITALLLLNGVLSFITILLSLRKTS